MSAVSRKTLLLLLLGLDQDGGLEGCVNGVTRLQKLLFLLEREDHVAPEQNGFEFEAYKAGPYSPKLYDDLELLENLGLIQTEASGESTPTESADISRLSFDDLLGGFEELDGASKAPDSFEERRFALTDAGRQKVQEILSEDPHADVVSGIKRLKTQFSHFSLRDLLRYVYKKYPDMTTESEIVEYVLGKKSD